MTRLEALRQLLALTNRKAPDPPTVFRVPQTRYQLPAPMTLAQWRETHGEARGE